MQPVPQASTASLVADRVREAIAAGEYAPGTQLVEVELARELGVSRGPLREGLQRLTQEGLVLSIRNRGLFVIEMTSDRVRDMYVARTAVERAAAEQVQLRDPAQAGEVLMRSIAEMEEAAAAGDMAVVSLADATFHQVLVEWAASPRLAMMHSTLLTETRMCLNAMAPTYAGHAGRIAEHRAIAQAFLDGDAALTDRLIVAHMRDGVQRLLPHADRDVVSSGGDR